MNTNIKSSLIIIAVLLIGAAIGFELSEFSIRKKFDKMESFREPKGFSRIFTEIIKPTEQQKPVIDSILTKYHEKADSVANANMKLVSAIMDSMNVDLGKVINPDQKKALDEEMLRMKKNPHPPPPPPDDRKH